MYYISMRVKRLNPLILLSILGSGCAVYVPPSEFKPYYDKFELGTGIRPTTDIVFKDLPEGTNGQCAMNAYSKHIYINLVYWKIFSDNQREELVTHELGHCELGLQHDNTLIVHNGLLIPKSVMTPYIFSGDVFEVNRDYYYKELFNPNLLY